MKDGVVSEVDPDGIVGYVAVPFWRWYENLSYA